MLEIQCVTPDKNHDGIMASCEPYCGPDCRPGCDPIRICRPAAMSFSPPCHPEVGNCGPSSSCGPDRP